MDWKKDLQDQGWKSFEGNGALSFRNDHQVILDFLAIEFAEMWECQLGVSAPQVRRKNYGFLAETEDQLRKAIRCIHELQSSDLKGIDPELALRISDIGVDVSWFKDPRSGEIIEMKR